MSKKLSVVLQVAFFALIFSVCRSQTHSLEVIPHIPDADIINTGSIFDIMADRIKSLPPATFSIQFLNRTVPLQPVKAIVRLEAWITLDEDHERTWLYKAESRPFDISPQGRTFSAVDTWDGSSDINFPSPEKNTPAIDRVKDKVMSPASGGRVPSGTYEVIMNVTVVQIGARQVHEDIPVPSTSVTVSNPTVATLIMPSENGYKYSSTFPQFQWIYDTRTIKLSVYQMRADQQSLEDATQASDPFLEVNINRRESGNLSQFTYPQTGSSMPGVEIVQGPRPLERGKTYVLVMEGLRSSIGTTVEPLRTIRSFTIDNPVAHAQSEMARSMFSAPGLQAISEILENQNLQIDVNGIVLNGMIISPQQLQAFFAQHQNRPFTIHIED